jgi:hypothetical protein|tara:strand:- start:3539 stop:3682 length:144 start_codon:yes stop_codon:yes gene_type:complete
MDISAWKSVWSLVFTVSSIMFYLTVAIVAYKGAGDVAQMIREMMAKR